jgi:hypothetical protein
VQLDVNGRINSATSYRLKGVDVLTTPGVTDFGAGPHALENIAGGSGDTAVGDSAMISATTAQADTAVGESALRFATTGVYNTAIGISAMFSSTTGSFNTVVGQNALLTSATGSQNVAVGGEALSAFIDGSGNIGIGYQAGSNPIGPLNNSIFIGNIGSSIDTSGVIRIGTIGSQTSFFAAGVRGITTGLNDAVPVVVDSNGQLGTVSSSRRFKENIQDMGEVSRGLMQLRPVTFRYQKPFADGSKPIQYGLVAEEVEQVYPDLVTHSSDGQVETVKYQVLDSMLLNEVQRQQAEIRTLHERLAKMEAMLASLSRASGNESASAARQ